MKASPAAIQKYLEWLEMSSTRIASLVKDVDEFRLQTQPDGKQWSVNDILAHLRACADLWGDSIEKMIAKDGQTLRCLHPRTWIKETDYPQLPFRRSLRAFKIQRRSLVKMLKALPLDDWSRGAILEGRRHTVFTQVRRMAKHESEHIGQIESLLK